MDGVKIHSTKKAKTSPRLKKYLNNRRKNNEKTDDFQKAGGMNDYMQDFFKRRRAMWFGAIFVMIVIFGAWLWILPTTLEITSQKTNNKDWDNLTAGFSEVADNFKKKSEEEARIRELRVRIFEALHESNENQSNVNEANNSSQNNNINQSIINANQEIDYETDNINIENLGEEVAGSETPDGEQ